MYKLADRTQRFLFDLISPWGYMHLENRWIRMADKDPWELFEVKYASLFGSADLGRHYLDIKIQRVLTI